jgi:cephalosporin hydroxylase
MPTVTPRPKNNKPRAKWPDIFKLPRRPRVAAKLPSFAEIKAILKHRKRLWGLVMESIASSEDSLIRDRVYKKRLSASLGTYLNWHLTDKRFLHSIDWMGIPARKLIFDLWIYQEIIHETRPDLIIEIGGFYGGSTLFLAQMQELLGHGEVLSIDVSHDYFMVEHPRIHKITGDCSVPAVLDQVHKFAANKTVMVIHDGDHTAAAVERDLRLYADLVSPGNYLIIEDGAVDLLNPKHSKLGNAYPDGGPLRASRKVYEEMQGNFEIDMRRERFILTTNPHGYWRRKTIP